MAAHVCTSLLLIAACGYGMDVSPPLRCVALQGGRRWRRVHSSVRWAVSVREAPGLTGPKGANIFQGLTVFEVLCLMQLPPRGNSPVSE